MSTRRITNTHCSNTFCQKCDKDDSSLLDELFNSSSFPNSQQIKSYEEACRRLCINPIQDWGDMALDEIAYIKLKTIVKALNGLNYKPLYYPLFWLFLQHDLELLSGSELKKMKLVDISSYFQKTALVEVEGALASQVNCGLLTTHLCFKTKELAVYCGEQFIKLWIDFLNPLPRL